MEKKLITKLQLKELFRRLFEELRQYVYSSLKGFQNDIDIYLVPKIDEVKTGLESAVSNIAVNSHNINVHKNELIELKTAKSTMTAKIQGLENYQNEVADYITQIQNWTLSGISGGKIVKYKSGRCEMYGLQSISTNYSRSRGSGMYSTEALTLNFPVVFKNPPVISAIVDPLNVGFVGYVEATTTKSTFALVNIGGSGSHTSKVYWNIKGELA